MPAIRQISHDPTLTQTVQLADGRRATALDIQWGLFERARKYEQSHGLEAVDTKPSAPTCSNAGSRCSPALETDPDSVAHQVDWVAKRRLVDGYAERHGIEPGSTKLKAIDLQYHDMRADRCLALRVGLDTLVSTPRTTAAMTEPPTTYQGLLPGPMPRQVR